MAAADYYTQVQEAYIAYYGRPADPAGLIYWANQLNQAGGNLNSIINAFGNSAESTALYSSGNLYAEVNQIYETLFGRAADSAGANYYVNGIQTGQFTLASVALNIYNGAQGADATALAAKLGYAQAFTNALLQNASQAAAYAGDTAAANARAAMQGVTDPASEQTGINNLPTTLGNIGAGTITYLTTGADVVTGSNIVGSLTPYNTDGKGPTLNYNDVITGSTGGTNNTLTLNDDYAQGNDVIPLGASISNIQNVVLQTAGNAGGSAAFDTSNISGVTSLTVKSAGTNTDNVKASATTAINVTHLSAYGDVDTFGGSAVTVTTNGGNVYVGGTGLAGENPTGAVTISAANRGTIEVFGGSTVNVSDAGQDSYIQVGTLGASVSPAEPTGAVTINSTGAGTAINVYGGTDVTVNSTGAADGDYTGNVVIGGEASDGSQFISPTGNVTVTVAEAVNASNKGADSTVTVYGGANVSVTTNAGDVLIGGETTNSKSTALLAGENATGAITVTDTNTAAKVTVYGGTDVTVSSAGSGTVQIGDISAIAGINPTGTVNVTQSGSGAVDIFGGTNVTVAAAGGQVTVGEDVYSPYPAGTVYAPSGSVTITDTAAATYDNAINSNDNEVNVRGGTNVSVTTNAGDVKVGSWTGLAGSEPTGTVTVTNTSLGGVSVFGGTNVTVNAAGGYVMVGDNNKGAAPSGNVTVTQSAVETGGQYRYGSSVNVAGGNNVTVSTTGGNVSVGTTTAVTTGAVSITDTYVGGGNTDAFSVIGGTTVGITTTATEGNITVGGPVKAALNTAGTALANAGEYASGNVTIVNESVAGTSAAGASNVYGTGNVTVATNGATSVSITGGQGADIVDEQTTLATGGANAGKAIGTSTLSSVTLNHVEGESSIVSDALTSLTILNGSAGAAYVVTNNTAGHALNLTIGGDGLTAPDFIVDATAGAVTVTDNGVASGAVLLELATATSLTVNTTATALLEVEGADLKTITLNNTGDLYLGTFEAAPSLTSIDASGSKGAVTVDLDPTLTTFKGGAGNDTVYLDNYSSSIAANTIVGGSGVNTLVADFSLGAPASVTLASIASGFTNLEVESSGNVTAFDATGFTGNLQVDGGNNVTFTNVAAGTTLTVTSNALDYNSSVNASVTYDLKTLAVSNSLSLQVGTDGPQANESLPYQLKAAGTELVSATVTANGIQNVTIDSQGYVAAGNGNTVNLADDSATTITIKGDQNLTLTETSGDTGTVTKIDASASTGTVNVTGVEVAASGVTVTGGAGELIASGAQSSGSVAQVNTVTLSGSYVAGDVITVAVNGTNYSYTVLPTDTTLQAVANGLAAAITSGAVTVGAVNPISGSYQFTLTAANAGTAFTSTESQTLVSDTGAITATTTVPTGASSHQVDSIAVSGSYLVGDVVRVDINGTYYTHTVVNGDTNASIVTALINTINAGQVVVLSANQVTASQGSGTSLLVQANNFSQSFTDVVSTVQVTHNGSTVDSTFIGNATGGSAVDVITTGSGGGVITLGSGGSNNGTGSETVNLSASTGVSDTIVALQGAVSVYNGVAGGVTGFVVSANAQTDDQLSFNGVAVQALANFSAAQNVATFVGASLTAQAATEGATLGNLTFTSTNGVLTFGAVGTHTVSEFTTAQLIAAARAIVESTGAPTVLEFVAGGNTYVVASEDAGGTLVNASVTELIKVTGVTGFSANATGSTILVDNFDAAANAVANTANTGTAKVSSYDETGFARAALTTASGSGIQTAGSTSTTFANLAVAAEVDVAAGTYASVIATQVGASGSNFLAVDFGGAATIASLSVSGDHAVSIGTNGADAITSLVDATNTVADIAITGASVDTLTIGGVTDTALKAIDASGFAGNLTLTASQAGLTILGATGGDTIVASGAGDTITVGSSAAQATAAVSITANGAGDTISLTADSGSATNHVIQASGAGDTITLNGGSDDTVYVGGTVNNSHVATAALGHGDTVNLLGSGIDNVWVGASSTVNLGSAFNGTAYIAVTGDVTGATSSGDYALTVINGANHGTLNLTLGNAAIELFAGGSQANAQVNVASATSLSQALDLAVKQALVVDAQHYGTGTGVGQHVSLVNGVLELNANTGLVTSFQYAGNTYVVEAVNTSTTSAAAHAALGANDVVIELAGQSTVGNVHVNTHGLVA